MPLADPSSTSCSSPSRALYSPILSDEDPVLMTRINSSDMNRDPLSSTRMSAIGVFSPRSKVASQFALPGGHGAHRPEIKGVPSCGVSPSAASIGGRFSHLAELLMLTLSGITTTSNQNSTLRKSRTRHAQTPVFSNGISEQRMLGPVSYTHLDVYKRQVRRATRPWTGCL